MKRTLILCASALLLLPSGRTPDRLTDLVNPLLGTATLWKTKDLGYERHRKARTWGAEVCPGSSVPNAMVQLTPVTMYHSGAGYQYEDTTICGFAHTCKGHWNLCHIPVLPVTGEVTPASYPSRYDHGREHARPGYYQVFLDDYGIDAELTSTLRCGFHRYTFPSGETKRILLDIARSNERVRDWSIRQKDARTLAGWQDTGSKVYFYAHLDADIEDLRFIGGEEDDPNHIIAVVTCKDNGRNSLEMRIGLSFVSEENARRNLEAELSGLSFDEVRQHADAEWERLLGRIRVKGGTERQRRIFYSTLYRSFLWPALRSDANGEFRDIRGEVCNEGFRYYTDPSFWDDHRNKLILLGLISPDVVSDVIRSITDKGEKRGGFMPTFFHGDHASVFIAGSARRGIDGFDLGRAYRLILRNATEAGRGGRRYMDEYLARGWISDKDTTGLPYYREFKGGVQKVLEYSYDDYATAQVALLMKDSLNYQRLMAQSDNYKNVFDPSTGFYRGRVDDGSWYRDFDPYYPYFQHMYREANAWNVLFYPPHDPEGVLALYPDAKTVEEKLDSLFTEPWRGYEVENMTGFIGQYCHGNQPGHHIPYTYCFIGRQEKCQFYLDEIMDRFYDMGDEGLAYAGMDDAGEMSAWYVLNAIGLYTYSPADPEYLVTVPIFDEVAFTQADGKVLTIRKKGRGPRIRSVRYQGRKLPSLFFPDADLKQGGTLVIRSGR